MSISFELNQHKYANHELSRNIQDSISQFFNVPKRGSQSIAVSQRGGSFHIAHQQMPSHFDSHFKDFDKNNNRKNTTDIMAQGRNENDTKEKEQQKSDLIDIDINQVEVVQERILSKDFTSSSDKNPDNFNNNNDNQNKQQNQKVEELNPQQYANINISEIPVTYMNSMDEFITNIVCQDSQKFINTQSQVQKSNQWLCHGNFGFNAKNMTKDFGQNILANGGGNSLSIALPNFNQNQATPQQPQPYSQQQPQQQHQQQQQQLQNTNYQNEINTTQDTNKNYYQQTAQTQLQQHKQNPSPQSHNQKQQSIQQQQQQYDKNLQIKQQQPQQQQQQYQNYNNNTQVNSIFKSNTLPDMQLDLNHNNNNNNNTNNSNLNFNNNNNNNYNTPYIPDSNQFNFKLEKSTSNKMGQVMNPGDNFQNQNQLHQQQQQQYFTPQSLPIIDPDNSINILLPILQSNQQSQYENPFKLNNQIIQGNSKQDISPQNQVQTHQYQQQQDFQQYNNDIQLQQQKQQQHLNNQFNHNQQDFNHFNQHPNNINSFSGGLKAAPMEYYKPPQQNLNEEEPEDDLSNGNGQHQQQQFGFSQTKIESGQQVSLNGQSDQQYLQKREEDKFNSGSTMNPKEYYKQQQSQKKKGQQQEEQKDKRLNTSHVPINMLNNLIKYLIPLYQIRIPCTCGKDNVKCKRCIELENIQTLKKNRCKNIQSFGSFWAYKRIRFLSEQYFLSCGPFQIQSKNYRSDNNRQALYRCLPAFLDGVRNHKLFWKLI